jgi:HAMP domain-containing protein
MKRRHLSIRARLTVMFVLVMTIVLVATGVAIFVLARHSTTAEAENNVTQAMTQVQVRNTHSIVPGSGVVVLPTRGEVVVQVTNLADNQVWAASSALAKYPVISREVLSVNAFNDYVVRFKPWVAHSALGRQLTLGEAQSISTPRGEGLVVGFIYGQAISRSNDKLMTSLAIAIPLILLVIASIVWFSVGLTLSPIEAIRRRVATIAANDLTERVQETGGDDEVSRMAKTLNAMLDRLEKSSRIQQEFISNASHELRSPLTTLLATVDRASNHLEETDWVEFTDTVRREGRRIDSSREVTNGARRCAERRSTSTTSSTRRRGEYDRSRRCPSRPRGCNRRGCGETRPCCADSFATSSTTPFASPTRRCPSPRATSDPWPRSASTTTVRGSTWPIPIDSSSASYAPTPLVRGPRAAPGSVFPSSPRSLSATGVRRASSPWSRVRRCEFAFDVISLTPVPFDWLPGSGVAK